MDSHQLLPSTRKQVPTATNASSTNTSLLHSQQPTSNEKCVATITTSIPAKKASLNTEPMPLNNSFSISNVPSVSAAHQDVPESTDTELAPLENDGLAKDQLENDDYDLNWNDFMDDMTLDKLDNSSGTHNL